VPATQKQEVTKQATQWKVAYLNMENEEGRHPQNHLARNQAVLEKQPDLTDWPAVQQGDVQIQEEEGQPVQVLVAVIR
jgi:hypothetical protein